MVELGAIRQLLGAAELIVVCGGGGIPVVRDAHGQYRGIEAVIDKDRTSALLAIGIRAEVFVILTGVDQVQSDYGKPNARALERITIREARTMLAAGQFPPGSMGPKIQAAIDYLEQSAARSAK